MEENTLEKLKKVREEVLKKFEELSLFVVIRRIDANLWDFVFAGEKMDQPTNLKPLVEMINKELNDNEIINISRLVLLNSDDLFAKNFNSTFNVDNKNGYLTIKDSQINNVGIKEAYLFFSKPR